MLNTDREDEYKIQSAIVNYLGLRAIYTCSSCVIWKIVEGAGDVRGWACWSWQWAGIMDHPNPVGPPGILPVSPMASPPLHNTEIAQTLRVAKHEAYIVKSQNKCQREEP